MYTLNTKLLFSSNYAGFTLLNIYFYFVCLDILPEFYVCVPHVCSMRESQKRGLDSLEQELTDSCLLAAVWMLETKPGPLDEQQALLATESPLQHLLILLLLLFICLLVSSSNYVNFSFSIKFSY